MSKKVIGLSGSLRKESYSTKLLKAFKQHVPSGYELEIVDISQLPLFNQDLEEPELAVVTKFKSQIKNADAVLLVTPEYNRSFSAAMKNALDWGSRPIVASGERPWDGKPVAVAGSSPYTFGGFGAVAQLRQVLVYVNLIPMQQPEFYLSLVTEKFDDNGNLIDETTQEKIEQFWQAFARHIDKIVI
jgi:chromate reductase, NAD(P)H dehydrogenase (quinone)